MNDQNNNGRFFNNVPNNQNMNSGNNFDPFTGQPINQINNNSVSEPINNFNQPMNSMPVQDTFNGAQQTVGAVAPQAFETPTPQVVPTMNFDPNTGKPLNGSSNKKGLFIAIGCIVIAAIIFFVFGVKVTTCSSEDEQYGVEVSTKVTSVAIFGDVKSAKFVMEYDFSDVDEDEKEDLMESLIETFEDEEDCKIKEKGDKIIISMEGFKDEDKGDYPIDEFMDNAEDLGLTCK